MRFATYFILSLLIMSQPIFVGCSQQEPPDLFSETMELYRAGDYQAAIATAQKALDEAEKEFDSDNPKIAYSLNNLALLHTYLGNYDQAEPLFLRALAIIKGAPELSDHDATAYMGNLGMLYKNQSRLNEAESLYVQVLVINENHFGSNHPLVANNLNDLGAVNFSMGKYDLAESLFRRALKIDEDKIGLICYQVARDLNNLAALYNARH